MKKLLTLVVLGLSVVPLAANAALVNHYSFNDGTGTDSVGGYNGTLTGGASIVGGVLTTGGASGDYLTLPGTFDPTVTGDFSIQIYARAATANQGQSFASLFSFATQPGDQNFLLFNPNRGNGNGTTTANFKQGTINNVETDVSANSALLSDGNEHNLLLTYVANTGVASIYNNGVLAGSGNPGAGFNFSLAAAGPFNGINGNGPFGDGSFVGSTNDFRIYNTAVTAAQATALNTAGANATNAQIAAILVPEPSTWAFLLGGAGLLGLALYRRTCRA